MSSAETENGGLGASAKGVAEHASALARLELELAQVEIKRRLTALGIGAGLAAAAALVALYAVGFLFATIAAGLATAMPWWLALLIVTLFLVLVLVVLGLVARSKFKGGPPVPRQAIEEAKQTTEALKT
jgi:Putative Actinobacterial Holin-X, holin superfamily III